jgi:uncharacterized membrane protein
LDSYALVKTVHIISAAILFGTGLGIAALMFAGMRSRELAGRHLAARWTVRADFIFTLPSVIVQPASGAWLVWQRGFDWTEPWLVATYALYALAGACWVPVVLIQVRISRLLGRAAAGATIDNENVARLFRWWFALGWPAFGGLVVIFWLMVAKPSW